MIRTCRTWALTWERRHNGQPVIKKGKLARTGNFFFRKYEAEAVHAKKLAEGCDPSAIIESVKDFLVF